MKNFADIFETKKKKEITKQRHKAQAPSATLINSLHKLSSWIEKQGGWYMVEDKSLEVCCCVDGVFDF